jgi:hypothetical protein
MQNRSVSVAAATALLVGLLSGCSGEPNKPNRSDNAFAIAVERSGGMVLSNDPFRAYRFTMTRDGSWEFTSRMKGEHKEGKVGADLVDQWIAEVKEGGFDRLKSNPKLGQTDGPYMEITLETRGSKQRKRIAVVEPLSKAIDKKVAELMEPGK